EIPDHHGGARLREHFDRRGADAAGTARDKHRLACERNHDTPEDKSSKLEIRKRWTRPSLLLEPKPATCDSKLQKSNLAAGGSGARRLHQCVKKRFRHLMAWHTLRGPLHPHDPMPVPLMLDGFNHPIRRDRTNAQATP